MPPKRELPKRGSLVNKNTSLEILEDKLDKIVLNQTSTDKIILSLCQEIYDLRASVEMLKKSSEDFGQLNEDLKNEVKSLQQKLSESELLAEINLIKEASHQFETNVSEKFNNLTTTIDTNYTNLKSAISPNISLDIRPKQQFNNSYGVNDEEDFYRLSRFNNVLIKNLPRNLDSDLDATIVKIGEKMGLNISPSDLSFAKRLPSASNSTGPPPVLVCFARRSCRDEFFFNYLKLLKSAPLKLKDMDDTLPESRIYICEHLCKVQSSYQAAAAKLKKNKKIWTYFTRTGLVFIVMNRGDQPKLVDDIAVLDDLK